MPTLKRPRISKNPGKQRLLNVVGCHHGRRNLLRLVGDLRIKIDSQSGRACLESSHDCLKGVAVLVENWCDLFRPVNVHSTSL